MKIPEFNTKKELFDFLQKNQNTLIAEKKAQLKRADAISFNSELVISKPDANKEEVETTESPDILLVKVVINTTNLMDSHCDVHLPGLWKKSLSENKMIMHLKEHEMEFDCIIADGSDLKAYTKNFNWTELGATFTGITEALVFESKIKRERNEFMFKQYQKGYVRNHSVGMQYVKLILCINDESYGAEYECWKKYYNEIANKETADEKGYFWAVTEAKVVEGSAVPIGSNRITPTLSTETKDEPLEDTQKYNEPLNDTQINISDLIKNVKICI